MTGLHLKIMEITITGKIEDGEDLIEFGEKLRDFTGMRDIHIKKKRKRRTLSQNSAEHLYENWAVEHCRELGISMTVFYESPSEVPVTKENLHLWVKKRCYALFGHEDTRKLNTAQFSQLVDDIQREFAEKIDFHREFPNYKSKNYGEKKSTTYEMDK